jgi:uncharacterized membrane protein
MNAFLKMFGGTMGCMVAVMVMGVILIATPIACTMMFKQAVKTREVQRQQQAKPTGTVSAPMPTTKGAGR